MTTNKKTLVIIAGAAGEIGTEYCKKLIRVKDTDVIGVIRNKKVVNVVAKNFTSVQCHLDNTTSIERSFENVPVESYKRVIFLHTIGEDKFNHRNYPNIQKLSTIDAEVYDTNVNSFKYILRYLVNRVESANENGINVSLKTAILGGVADKYAPFVIEDFCEAKLILRGYIRSYIDIFPDWFSGISINITSTITDSALAVRPHANTKDWLTPEEVVKNSVAELLSSRPEYKEIDIIKFSKNFVKGYYENHKSLYEKWSFETGIVSPAVEM